MAESAVTTAAAVFNVSLTFVRSVPKPSLGNFTLTTTHSGPRTVAATATAVYGATTGTAFNVTVTIAAPYGPGTVNVTVGQTVFWYSTSFVATFGTWFTPAPIRTALCC